MGLSIHTRWISQPGANISSFELNAPRIYFLYYNIAIFGTAEYMNVQVREVVEDRLE
jgi:hypothetical protein